MDLTANPSDALSPEFGKEAHTEPRSGSKMSTLPGPVQQVIDSEIGVATLLGKLKQSVMSTNEFAAFLKKRAAIEEIHAKEIQRLTRHTREGSNRKEGRQGSHLTSMDSMMAGHDNMADNGLVFAYSIHTMYENLTELSNKIERQRKTWKHSNTQAEKKSKDAELQMAKAKAKYNSAAEEYELARSGDRSSNRPFKFRQHSEEELRQRLEVAESEYKSKVQLAQQERNDLVASHRPQAILNLKELIEECDAGLDLQMQKFATFNEKLVLSDGLVLSPLKSSNEKGINAIMSEIDSHRDFCDYILDYRDKTPVNPPEIKYEQHPSLISPNQQPITVDAAPQLPPIMSSPEVPAVNVASNQASTLAFSPTSHSGPTSEHGHRGPTSHSSEIMPFHPSSQENIAAQYPTQAGSTPAYPLNGPPQPQFPGFPQRDADPSAGPLVPINNPQQAHNAPPFNPNRVFNISLADYSDRAQEFVPALITQCIETLKHRGMDCPGLYVANPSPEQLQHVYQLADMYMSVPDSRPVVTWQNPKAFNGDPCAVAELICYWLAKAPEPLICFQSQKGCFDAISTGKSVLLHTAINELPNPNYATLHRLTYHLRAVASLSQVNNVTIRSLAAKFGPLLFRPTSGSNNRMAIESVETILLRWDDFFEPDE